MNIENPENDRAADVGPVWSEEVKRRLTDIDAGTVALIPWEEVREELFDPIAIAGPSQP